MAVTYDNSLLLWNLPLSTLVRFGNRKGIPPITKFCCYSLQRILLWERPLGRGLALTLDSTNGKQEQYCWPGMICLPIPSTQVECCIVPLGNICEHAMLPATACYRWCWWQVISVEGSWFDRCLQKNVFCSNVLDTAKWFLIKLNAAMINCLHFTLLQRFVGKGSLSFRLSRSFRSLELTWIDQLPVTS